MVFYRSVNDRFTVIACQKFLYFGFGIEGLATEDDVRQDALLAIFLQGVATELQVFGEFFVGEVSLTVYRWTVGLQKRGKPIVGFLQGQHGGGYGSLSCDKI